MSFWSVASDVSRMKKILHIPYSKQPTNPATRLSSNQTGNKATSWPQGVKNLLVPSNCAAGNMILMNPDVIAAMQRHFGESPEADWNASAQP